MKKVFLFSFAAMAIYFVYNIKYMYSKCERTFASVTCACGGWQIELSQCEDDQGFPVCVCSNDAMHSRFTISADDAQREKLARIRGRIQQLNSSEAFELADQFRAVEQLIMENEPARYEAQVQQIAGSVKTLGEEERAELREWSRENGINYPF